MKKLSKIYPFAVICLAALYLLTLIKQLRTCEGSLNQSNANFDINISTRWTATDIVQHMNSHPDRAYFADLFRKGGFRTGMEVGVASGRYSEHFLRLARERSTLQFWHMIEPFPNEELKERFKISSEGTANFQQGSWSKLGVGTSVTKKFSVKFSTDESFLAETEDEQYDFIYLDGAHNFDNVKAELMKLYSKVRPGGVLAGHDYCNHGEPGRECLGCQDVPLCQPYTQFGVEHGKPPGVVASNMAKVVYAVHDWILETHPNLRLHHTTETFTRDSLASDGMDFDLVITNTRNPSWFFIRPEFPED